MQRFDETLLADFPERDIHLMTEHYRELLYNYAHVAIFTFGGWSEIRE